MHHRPLALATLRTVPSPCSWGDQRLVRERSIAQRSPAAWALSRFLVTVADAQGLSFYSEQSLCQRLSMAPAVLRQARQALIACALVAYQRPLYQVLALDRVVMSPAAVSPTPAGDVEPVDLKAVGKQLWEGWS